MYSFHSKLSSVLCTFILFFSIIQKRSACTSAFYRKKMKIRYVISLTVLLSAIFCLFLYNFLATNGLPLRERVIQYNPANSSKNKVYVLLEKHKEKQWDEHSNMCGFELDCYIHNENSCLSVTDWEVTFLVPKRTYIDSNPWSAVFELH